MGNHGQDKDIDVPHLHLNPMAAAPPVEGFGPVYRSSAHRDYPQIHQEERAQAGQKEREQDETNVTPESEGWLPTANAPEQSSAPRKGSILKSLTSQARNGTLKRESTSQGERRGSRSLTRNESTSRRSVTTSEAAFMGGRGTSAIGTGAEENEEIAARAASANEALTPKQRAKVVKSEGSLRVR